MAIELTVAVDSLVVVGTPIAEAEYFARLGERFQQAVEPAVGRLSFHHGENAARELEHGWQEDQLRQIAQTREQSYRRFGQFAQRAVREQVQGRPQRIREYPLDDEAEQSLQVQLAGLLGDEVAPARRFLHLRDAVIVDGAATQSILPLWRVRLSEVTAWQLGRPEPGEG